MGEATVAVSIVGTETNNVETAIGLLGSWSELIDAKTKPNSIAAVLYGNLSEILLAVHTAPSQDLEGELFTLVEPFMDFIKALQNPFFSNPTMEELTKILSDMEKSEHFRKQVTDSDSVILRLTEELEAERKVSAGHLEQIEQLRFEADNVAERMLREIKDPNSPISRAINNLSNKLDYSKKLAGSIESLVANLNSGEFELRVELDNFAKNFSSNLPARAITLGGTEQSLDSIRLEIETLVETASRLGEELSNDYDKVGRIENKIIPNLEIFQTHYKRKNAAARIAKLRAVVEQIKAHSQELLVIETNVKARHRELVAIREMVAKTNTEFVIPVIPDLVIDLTNVKPEPVAEVSGNGKSRNSTTKVVKPKVDTPDPEWYELFNVPTEPFVAIAEKNGMDPVEVLFCTLYDMLPKKADGTFQIKSLMKVVWTAAKVGLLANKRAVTTVLTKGWWGNKADVYSKHPKIRAYLDPKPMRFPSYQRTHTSLPWRPADLIDQDMISHFRALLQSE